MLEGAYISKQGLQGLNSYSYHGVDHSLVAKHIFQPFWNRAVNILPRSMAPNLVTLTGFGFIVLSYVLMVIFEPNMRGYAPSWVYAACAINLFFYQTLDALDGKQARRTGSSSPLGELFDHGCDACTTVFSALTVGTAIQIGGNWILYAFVMICMITFYTKQWEEYHTGIMELGYVNVTEAQLITIFTFSLSAWFGPDFWLTEINILDYQVKYQWIALGFAFVGGAFNILESVYISLTKCGVSSLINMVPTVVASIFIHLWVLQSEYLLSKMPHPFFLGVGFLYSNLVGRIVLARVCKSNFSPIQPIVLFAIFGFVNAFFGRFLKEEIYVWIFCFVNVFGYLHFALSVIHDICKHLKINCLTLKTAKD